MSTRANIVIKDNYSKLWFYRHSDGYPETTAESLGVFMSWLRSGMIRDNTGQAAGWLIILGNSEYDQGRTPNKEDNFSGWKVGAYEPTTGIHGDIEYLYEIDLEKQTLRCFDTWTAKGVGKNEINLKELA